MLVGQITQNAYIPRLETRAFALHNRELTQPILETFVFNPFC